LRTLKGTTTIGSGPAKKKKKMMMMMLRLQCNCSEQQHVRVYAQLKQDFSNQLVIVAKTSDTASIRFDGQPVTQWSRTPWGYSIAAFPITHGIHYITTTSDTVRFGAYVMGHSIIDTSSSAYGYTAGFQGEN